MELWYLFCTHCLIIFYICTVLRKYLKGFRVTNSKSRVKPRVVPNVDGWTNGQKAVSLYFAMPEAGRTKTHLPLTASVYIITIFI